MRNLMHDPVLTRRLGLGALALSLLSRWLVPVGWLSRDQLDAGDGFLVGIAIGLLLVSVLRARR